MPIKYLLASVFGLFFALLAGHITDVNWQVYALILAIGVPIYLALAYWVEKKTSGCWWWDALLWYR